MPLPNGIILPDGYVEQDPRLPGLNYLSLAVLGRDQAQQAVRYLGQNRVEAFAVPLDRDGSVINNAPPLAHRVYVGPGVTSQQYRANDPVMKQLESEVERLGKTWSKDFKGPSDFRSPGWIKYKGKS